MTALLCGVAAVAVPLVLLGSAAGHVRRPGALASALRSQGVFPSPVSGPLAVLVIVVEGAVGACAAVATLWTLDGTFRVTSLASASLLGLYALYAGHVTRAVARAARRTVVTRAVVTRAVARTRRGVPCGCSGDPGTPMTGWVAARAAALAALALPGAAWGPPDGTSAYETSVIVAAGLGVAVILWTLPHAMFERTVFERTVFERTVFERTVSEERRPG